LARVTSSKPTKVHVRLIPIAIGVIIGMWSDINSGSYVGTIGRGGPDILVVGRGVPWGDGSQSVRLKP
jgi:hypothetical protein